MTDATSNDASRNVVRGGLLLMLAKLVHTIAGFGLFFFLAAAFQRAMGGDGTAAFGIYGTLLVVINPLNMMFAQGTLQLVSRTVASRPDADPAAVFRACARVQVPFVLGFVVLFQLAVPTIARDFLNDPSYVPGLRLGGVIPLFYAVRCLYQGYCNGTRRFREQSWIDMGSSILRMLLVLGGAALGFGALGALAGFVVASAVMMLVAIVWIRPSAADVSAARVDARSLFGFQGKVLGVTLVTFFLMSLDQVAVKALAHPDPEVTDRLAGYFTGSQKIAQIPWGIVSALVWVLFPLVAESASREKQRETLRQGFRLVLLLLVPVCAVLMSTAHETFGLVFASTARRAIEVGDPLSVVSGPLQVMAVGYLVYGLLIVATMLLTAQGRAGTTLLIMGGTLVLCRLLTTRWVVDHGPMGASAGSAVAWTVGLAAAMGVLVRSHGAILSGLSLVRILLAGAAVVGVASVVPGEGLMLLPRDALLGVTYLAAVMLLGELRPSELTGLLGALRGRKAAAPAAAAVDAGAMSPAATPAVTAAPTVAPRPAPVATDTAAPAPTVGLAQRALLAGLLVSLLEWTWLASLGVRLGWSQVAHVFGVLVPAAALAVVAVTLLFGLLRRAVGARAELALALLALPLVVVVTRALFSGHAARELTGVAFLRGGFGLALFLGVLGATRLFVRFEAGPGRGRPGRVLLCAAALLAWSWADSHLQVGLYPAFHAVLAAATVAAAAALAGQLLALGAVGQRARAAFPRVAWSLLALCAATSWLRWDAFETTTLARYSNALIPKWRQGVTALGRWSAEPEALAKGRDDWVDEAVVWTPDDDIYDVRPEDRPVVEPAAASGTADASDPPVDALGAPVERLVDSAFDARAWRRGGKGAEVEPDGAAGPGGARTADRVDFAAGIATLVRTLDVPAAGGRFEAEVWARAAGSEPVAVDVMFMIERGDAHARQVFEVGPEWTRLQIEHAFPAEAAQGRLSLRIGNVYHDPRPISVWLDDARVLQVPSADSASAPTPDTAAAARVEPAPREPVALPDGDPFAFRPTTGALVEPVRAAARNVVFVLLDAFRDDHLGKPGPDGRSLTPHLDALADEAVRFDTCYAPSDHTGRSMPCLMTSLPLGVVTDVSAAGVSLESWLEVLEDQDFRTYHNGSDYVSRKYSQYKLAYGFGAQEHGTTNPRHDDLVDEVLEFVGRPDERPFAVYTHISDAHVKKGLKDTAAHYAEMITRADARMGALVAGLRAAGVWDETLLVVTADHGYALGEGGRYLGGQGSEEYMLRVPLLMRIPGSSAGGTRVGALTSSLDVVPTLLDVLAPDARMSVAGRSLLGHALDADAHPWPQARPVSADMGWMMAARQGPWKLTVDVARSLRVLYDVERDPHERAPVDDPERMAAMNRVLGLELSRQGQLTTALIVAARKDIDPRVVAAVAGDFDAPTAATWLETFWELGSPSRRYLLRAVFDAELRDLGPNLADLERDAFEADDQIVAVVRAWSGEAAAAALLVERFDELGVTGRRWLSELLEGMPRDVGLALAPRLLDELERLRALPLEVGHDDERFAAMTLFGLAGCLGEEVPAAVKRGLRDTYNAYAAIRPQYIFSTIARERFAPNLFVFQLDGLVTDDDLDLLGDLHLEPDSAWIISRVCRRLDSARSRSLLEATLRREDLSVSHVNRMLDELNEIRDASWRAELDTLVQARFPGVVRLDT